MKNTKKKILSLLLTAVLVLSLIPCVTLTTWAATTTYSINDGSVNITEAGDYELNGGGSVTTNTITIASNIHGEVNIVLSGVNIDVSAASGACAFSIGTGSTVNLTLTGTNTLKSGANCAGLQVPAGAILNITADSTGALSASGGGNGAGIGSEGKSGSNCGTITVGGGKVTAYGSGNGAGIGGGGALHSGSGGKITITDGEITAYGGSGNGGTGGSGIGGGGGDSSAFIPGGSAGEIKISGGKVNATGGFDRPGIGGDGGTTAISGGEVTAKGGIQGSGIGTSQNSMYSGTVTITGGNVTSTGGDSGYGAGIGGQGMTVNINDGIIKARGGSTTVTDNTGNLLIDCGGGIYGNVTINGGSITASGGSVSVTNNSGTITGMTDAQAGINGIVTINGGNITATGGGNVTVTNNSGTVTMAGGAGIGGLGGAVTINGGMVTANGSCGGAGIGGNTSRLGNDVTIAGGTVVAKGSVGSSGSGEDIGSGSGNADHGTCIIQGGSINASIGCSVFDSADTSTQKQEYLTTVNGLPASADSGYSVDGKSDVLCSTDDAGILYLWLPETSVGTATDVLIAAMTVADTAFYEASGPITTGANSLTANLVTPGVTIDAQPSGKVVLTSEAAVLSVSATGLGVMHYQWCSNDVDSNSGGSKIDNATSAEYSVPTITSGTTYYYCVITETVGGHIAAVKTSGTADVAVVGVRITVGPADSGAVIGGTVTLHIAATGANANSRSYQWYSNDVDSNNGGIKIDGATDASYSPPTASADTIYYYCVVTDAIGTVSDSKTSGTATVIIVEDTATSLSSLSVSGGLLSPSFDKNKVVYNVTIGTEKSISITAVTQDSEAILSINGQAAKSGMESAVSLTNGANLIPVTVTSKDGLSQKSYILSVNGTVNNAELKSLSIGGTAQTVNASTASYTYSVGSDVTLIDIKASSSDSKAIMLLNGAILSQGGTKNVPLSVGENILTLMVIAQDASTKTYTITVNRGTSDATLSALSLSAGTLSPSFSSGIYSYTATVPHSTASLTVTPTASDSYATVTVNGGSSTAPVALSVGSNTIIVVVTGKDGVTKKTYTVIVTRQPTITITTESLPVGIVSASYSKSLSATGGSNSYTWSWEAASGSTLPSAFTLSTAGVLSVTSGGKLTDADIGSYKVNITVADVGNNTVKQTQAFTLTIRKGCGNGAYLIESDGDAAYTGSYTDDGIPTLTVNTGVSGFKYFGVNITAVTGHPGTEVCLFVHMRNGQQIGIMSDKGDFDNGGSPSAAFNVKAGDIIKVYIVDALSNDADSNPNVL